MGSGTGPPRSVERLIGSIPSAAKNTIGVVECGRAARSNNHGHITAQQISRQQRQAIELAFGPSILRVTDYHTV